MLKIRCSHVGRAVLILGLMGCSSPPGPAQSVSTKEPLDSEATETPSRTPREESSALKSGEPTEPMGKNEEVEAVPLAPVAPAKTLMQEAPPSNKRETALLTLPSSNRPAQKPRAPYWIERTSSIIAIAKMGRTVGRGTEARTNLQIQRVLLGQLDGKSVRTPDQLPNFGCIPPKEPITASSLHKEGTEVVIYLNQSAEGGFQLRHIERVPAEGVRPWLLRFGELKSAYLRGEGKAAFSKLLENEAWEKGSAAAVALNGTNFRWHPPLARSPVVGQVVLAQLAQCSQKKNETYLQLSERIATMLSVVPDEARHKGLLSALGCMKGHPAGYVTGAQPAVCKGFASDAACCPWGCKDRESFLDLLLPLSLQGASKKELSALKSYVEKRAKVGVLVAAARK